MLIIGALSCAPLPFGKKIEFEVTYFTTFKVLFNCSFIPLIMNPFINDYVMVQDRGLAMGLQNMGLTCGTLVSVGGLYTATNFLKPEFSFPLLSIFQLLWIVIILSTGMISEPTQMSEKEKRAQNKKSMCGKVYSVLKQTIKACKKDHALAIGLLAISISRNGAML